MLRICVLALLLSLGVAAPPAAAETDAWAALKEPGRVAIMRHALAPGTGDPADFELGDCSTQRNLNDAGRAQARRIGAALRAHDIAVDRVLTSQWCRCRDTAALLNVGPVADMPALNSFFRDRSTAERQTQAVRDFLADLPEGERVVMVTHQVNITALTDVFPRSGELLVIEPDDQGAVEVVASVLIR